MKAYTFSGRCWSGPGRSSYEVYGPYLTKEEGEAQTKYVQAHRLYVDEIEIPDWFGDLILAASEYWDRHLLNQWAVELKLIK